jgi:hypothetical protein
MLSFKVHRGILVVFLAAATLVLFFALMYQHALPAHSLHSMVDGAAIEKPNFSQAAYMSVGTQSLLGLGDYVPANGSARALVATQSAITLGWFILQGVLIINESK